MQDKSYYVPRLIIVVVAMRLPNFGSGIALCNYVIFYTLSLRNTLLLSLYIPASASYFHQFLGPLEYCATAFPEFGIVDIPRSRKYGCALGTYGSR